MTIAGLILASGESRRFGRSNKLLAELGGEAIVRRTARAFLEADLQPVTVVVGFQATAIAAALAELEVRLVANPNFREGQSAALRRGIRELGDADAAVIGVADQPLLTAPVVRDLVREWEHRRSGIVVPRYLGARGNPVVFSRTFFAELEAVRGDVGGRAVIGAHADVVTWLDIDDGWAGIDIDSPTAYRTIRKKFEV